MNKIFRVIYSQATQSWVAVSELTKAHKKQSSSNAQKNAVNISGSIFKSSVIALGLLTGANAAYAVNTPGTGGATDVALGAGSRGSSGTSVAIGKDAAANNTDGISIGAGAVNSKVGAEGAIAIGKNAKNDKKESIAIGVSAKNVSNNSIAIGDNAETQNGEEAIAIGSKAVAKPQSVALGVQAAASSKGMAIGYTAKATAEYAIAQGYNASSSKSDSIAVGRDTVSSGGGSVALGETAQATGNHALAIGPRAQATAALGDTIAIGYNSKATAYRAVAIANQAIASGENAVSIGWEAKATGTESATIGDNAQAQAEHSIAIGSRSNAREENAIAVGTQADAAKRNALSLGTSSRAGQDAVAAGYNAHAADNSVSLGSGSETLNEAGIAIGKGAKSIGLQGAIAAGLGTRAVGHSSIMIGGSDISDAANQTVNYVEEDHTKVTDVTVDEMINGAKVKRHYKVIGTDKKSDTLATAYKALTGKTMDTSSLDYSKVTNGHSSISLGIHALSEGHLGTAIGTGARAKSLGSIALGAGAVADRQNAVAIGTGSTTELQGSRQTDVSYNAAGSIVSSDSPDVAYTFKWAGGINTSAGDVVSFGSAGAERQLKNVAAGRVAEDSTDAINGSQLNSVARKVASGWQIAGDNKTKVSGIGTDEQVNFTNGSGTTVTVTAQDVVKETVTENGKQVEKIKTPKGANVKFDVKAADTSLEVGANGVKVKASDGIETTTDGIKVNTGEGLKIDTANGNKVAVNTDGTTITVDNKGKVKAVTGSIETVTDDNKTGTEKAGQVRVADTEKGKLATVDAVASAVNNAAWSITSGIDGGGSFATSGLPKAPKKISAGGSVTFKAGDNLIIKQVGTNFTYSLNPILSELTSAEFKGTGANAPTTKLTNEGITVTTPADAAANTPEKTVTLNQDGLNNGGNAIAHVAGNLDGAKTGTTAPTTKADKPTTLNNSNAATVGDVLNAGWNLQEKGTAKDFVAAYDTVNFIDGDGTSVSVENTDNKTSKIKYSVNLGDGLDKDAATNKIKVKAADKSLEVTNDGVKVKAADKTLTTDANGLKVNTGNITASSVPTVADADKGKIATVDNVADAIKAAAWKATAAKTNDGENGGTIKEQEIKAGDTVTFEADKNIKIAQDGSKFTFSTKDNVEFKSVKVGEDKDGKKPVNLTTDKATDVSNNDPANKPTTALNVSSDGKPTQITGVGSVLNTNAVPTIPAGTATDAAQQPKLVNLGTAHGQTTLDNNVLNAAATVRDLANMGWKVSSDETTGAKGAYLDVVKNADEVKFVGKNAAKVSGKTENGVRTITVDVEVPDVKTAKLVSSTDGSVIAPSTDSKLQDALKAAKDELAALPKDATDEQKKEAEKKVKDAETALNNALDDKGVATAKNVADMINNSGFTLKTSATVDGKKDNASTGSEVIKPGKTVEMVAGKNLTVKQDADGKVTYSLNPELISLTSAEFKAAGTNAPTTKLTNSGVTITPATTGKNPVSLTENGLNNGGNAIADVAGNLDGAKTGTTAPTDSAAKPATLTETNAATVGDVLNSGWNIQEKGTAKDFVKTYDTVNFAQGDGTDVSVSVSDDKQTSTVKYSVKAIDKSLKVGADGVKVKTSDGIETTTDGITVKAADKTLTVGKDGVKVNTGAIAAANGGEDQTTNRGKVTVTPKTKADGTTETQAEAETRAASEIATVKNVADAINSAAWIAKVENTDDSVDTPTEDDKGTAVKAGDTLNLKAGKNLKVNRTEKDITFALAKDITVDTANVENTLTIGKDGAKVNIASGANGLTLAGTETAADGSTNNNAPVYLNGIKPTLPDTLAGGTTAHIVGNIDAAAYHRAASVQDVLNAGWNIQGAKQAGGEVENVDFVRTYDTVDFVSGNKATTDVTVTEKEGGKGAVVTITAKNDAGSITTAGGKVVVGTNNQADTDPKAGDKVAKTGDVANAINQSGWKTNATKIDGVAATDTNKTQLINPGDAVNYENGNGTVANVEVTQGKDGNPDTVSVKYDVKADGTTIKVGDDGKVTAVTGETETVTADANGKKKGQLKAKTGDGSKLATVESVANAVNSAKWYAKADNDQTATVSDTGKTNDEGEEMGAGNTLTLTAGKNLRVKREGGKFTFATVETPEFEGLKLVQGGNTVNIAPTANGLSFSRPAATAGGAKQPVTLSGISSGLDKFDTADPKTEGLLNLNKTEAGKTEPAVGDNTAATVGDLRGMGWVLSADKKTDNPAKTYNAQVKNAEEVKFVGASGVIVSGKTEGNVRTITVGVDHQLATNNSVKPVEYTKKDGTKVYPKTVTKNDGTTETKFYPNADGTGDEVPAGDVIVSVNGANGTKSPTTLSNVKSNLPETRNTADAGNPASKSQSAPTIGTADGNVNANNAATVGDILNSGWNLKGNGNAVDFVRAYDTVNFVNGKGTTVSIETDGKESRVKVDVDTGVITAETKDGKATGKVAGPVANAADLSKAIKDAQDELAKAVDEQAKKTAQTKLDTANKAADEAGLNKVATAQNVADMINNSGFTLKTSATAAADNLTADNTLKNDGEVINPGKTVEMVAGKNLTVKQDAGGKVTYATKDDVEFATVKIGKDEDGKKPVSLTTEAAKEASNNDVANKPATALKISSDGKPAQLVGVASVLNASKVTTKPDGDKKADGTSAESKTEKLIDLAGTDAAPVNKNAAATVGDLQSMGWVVSTKDGNGYTDVVKNANEVDFKGGNGIEVTGTTTDKGVREITVSIKEGEVTNYVTVTKADGKTVDAVKIGDTLYERDKDGKPKRDESNNLITVTPAAGDTVENKGSGFVTGNTVANAINKSGWNVGLAKKADADAAFGDSKYAQDAGKPEKVNPDDNVHFANGNNTVVKAATVEKVNEDGKTVTNTYIRVDAELPISQISAVDENGNKVVKDADGNWYPGKADGTADKTQPKVDPAKVRQSASMDPENKGDRYTPLAKRSDDAALTADQKDALSKQQDQYAQAAADKIAEQLKGQPQAVIEAAQKAAAEVARVEAKDKYLKDNGLDKGIGGTVITNVAWGQKPDDAVNVDQLQNSGWNLDSRAVAGSSGKVISGNVSPSKVKMDETVNIDAGNNIEITRNGKNIEIATSMAPQFSSVSLGAGADAPTLSVDGDALNVGSKKDNKPVRITNVAPGVKEGDVTNVAQLKGVAQNLNNRIDNVDGNARAGIAQAIATAGLVQAYLPGKSMMAIGGGTYRGEAGYAIGYSSISDGGNWIIKGTASGNSRGHFGTSASVGYQW